MLRVINAGHPCSACIALPSLELDCEQIEASNAVIEELLGEPRS
jgi:hypothetical protein